MNFSNMDFKSNNSTQRFNIIKIRIDDGDYDPDKKDFLTTIDNFDLKLYSETIQGKTKFEIFQKEQLKKETLPSLNNKVRFKESNLLHRQFLKEKETISNYLFKSGIEIDPLHLKGGFKKKLTKIHKNTNQKKNTVHFEQNYSSNDVALKRRVSQNKIKDLSNKNLIFANYETNDEPNTNRNNKSNNSYKPPYTSTLNLLNSKVQKKDILLNDFNLPDLNVSKDFKIPDDSVFSNRSKIIHKNRHNRPDFVERLFESYDYADLDPWNKIQNHTKNKNLCLSVIKDIYNKITF